MEASRRAGAPDRHALVDRHARELQHRAAREICPAGRPRQRARPEAHRLDVGLGLEPIEYALVVDLGSEDDHVPLVSRAVGPDAVDGLDEPLMASRVRTAGVDVAAHLLVAERAEAGLRAGIEIRL